jgi:hypothetical protein
LDNHYIATAANVVKPADFFLPQHRRIFDAMIGLDVAGSPIDIITLMEKLDRDRELDAAGGVAYLSQLADGLPRVTNVEHYARIVKQKSVSRALIYTASAIQEQALAADEDVDAILARASDSITALRSASGAGGEPAGWREMFHSYEDFERSAPLTFSIEGFLQNDGATMIGGLSGHAKTFILLSITKALLVTGKDGKLWDTFRVTEDASRVLYLIPESSLAPFKHRLKLFGLYRCLAPKDGRNDAVPERPAHPVRRQRRARDSRHRDAFQRRRRKRRGRKYEGTRERYFRAARFRSAQRDCRAPQSKSVLARKRDATRERAPRIWRHRRDVGNRLGREANRRRTKHRPHRKR